MFCRKIGCRVYSILLTQMCVCVFSYSRNSTELFAHVIQCRPTYTPFISVYLNMNAGSELFCSIQSSEDRNNVAYNYLRVNWYQVLLWSLVDGQRNAPPGSDFVDTNVDGSYNFGYNTGDEGGHYHSAGATADNTVTGRYSPILSLHYAYLSKLFNLFKLYLNI